LGNHELLLGTLRKKEFSKEIQGVVAAVLDSRVRVPNPVGVETVLRMVGRCGKIFELCNMGIIKTKIIWKQKDVKRVMQLNQSMNFTSIPSMRMGMTLPVERAEVNSVRREGKIKRTNSQRIAL
jgi:hypothetical protein